MIKKIVYYKYLGDDNIWQEKPPKLLNLLYNTMVGRVVMKIISTKRLSRMAAKFLDSRASTVFIGRYIRKNKIDMDEFESVKYSSFNDFFTRKKKNVRCSSNLKDFVATATSRVTCFEIDDDLAVDIKGSKYSVREMLKDSELAKEYSGGLCLVFRLSPADFHRYIYCDDGFLGFSKHIEGVLHTVNPISYQGYKIFHENDRVVSELDTKKFGKIIQIEVGALCVGKIVNENVEKFKRYQEKGHFEFGGSTIVQLIEKNRVRINREIVKNSKENIETYVEVGEKIGELCDF